LIEVTNVREAERVMKIHGSLMNKEGLKKELARMNKVLKWVSMPIDKSQFEMPDKKRWEQYKKHFHSWKQYALQTQDQAIKGGK